MPIQYQIKGTVLTLKVAREGFAELRSALHAAETDPRARPGMSLLIDARTEANGVRYDDVRYRVDIMAQMRDHFGPRWAIVTGTQSVPVGVGRMFAVFSEIEGLQVGMFADEEDAIRWLTEP
jgi:hypothetical protein